MSISESYETLKGEHLKAAAEKSLHIAGEFEIGRRALEYYAFGSEGRIIDEALRTEIAGLDLENPVMVGAGWDKKGRAINGLYSLGFSAIEVGTVTLFAQSGNKKPRLWTIDGDHSVGMNRLGFNSDGAEAVGENLSRYSYMPCPIGGNIGLNKLTPVGNAPWAHAAAVEHLYPYVSYFSLGISSPNTKQVRSQQNKETLTNITQEVHAAMDDCGERKPLWYKIDGDQSEHEAYGIVEVAVENNASGIIAINTTTSQDIKAKYGRRWADEQGGLSGADADYRRKAIDRVNFLYEEAGDQLDVIGVGGIDSARTALDMIKVGASAVQVVTAIRPSFGRVAAHINHGLREQIDKDGTDSIRDYIGYSTVRGVKPA